MDAEVPEMRLVVFHSRCRFILLNEITHLLLACCLGSLGSGASSVRYILGTNSAGWCYGSRGGPSDISRPLHKPQLTTKARSEPSNQHPPCETNQGATPYPFFPRGNPRYFTTSMRGAIKSCHMARFEASFYFPDQIFGQSNMDELGTWFIVKL